jgi:hypothetical protein
LTENKFLSIKPLNIARQYLASARLIRVKVYLIYKQCIPVPF